MQEGACQGSHSSVWGAGRGKCSGAAGVWPPHTCLRLAVSLLLVCCAGPGLERCLATAEA